MARRGLMLTFWRFQQSQAILGLILWGVLLTVSSYPIVGPVIHKFLDDRFGLAVSAPGAVLVTLGILFALIMAALLGFGVWYDKYLRLWREQVDVTVDRNPYTREKLTAKEILTWRHMFLPALRSASAAHASDGPGAKADPDVEAHIAFMEDWIERSLDDPRTRKAVEETKEWIRPKA